MHIEFLYCGNSAKLRAVPVTAPDKSIFSCMYGNISNVNGRDMIKHNVEEKGTETLAHNIGYNN